MMRNWKIITWVTVGALLSIACPVWAEVRLPAIFSDHMVLQQNATVPIWGWAEAGEEITVELAGQKRSTRAEATGKWKVELKKLQPGATLTLTVKGKNSVVVKDVLVGEVWLGSGQSNMARTTKSVKDFEKERVAASLPKIRMFKVDSGGAIAAQDDCRGSWTVCSPDTVGNFSGVLFYFGRELHRTLEAPVGLIHSSVGGTMIEQWIDAETQRAVRELRPLIEEGEAVETRQVAVGKKPNPQAGPGRLFNGKIAPLIPYAIRGMVWYQGEGNSKSLERARYYERQLPLLIEDWRKRWGYEFPCAWVQLPNWAQNGEPWCVIREAQLKALRLPKTGMAVTVDIGDSKDVHPMNKDEVGRRLSLWALGSVYGRKVTAISGPVPADHEIKDDKIIVNFRHADDGLNAKGGEVKGFMLAGEDRQWHLAQARIAGKQVVVSCAEVKQPLAVRYAWQADPDCNLFNGAGLPASPFRTDDWK